MKRLAILAVALTLGLSLSIPEAEARRMGGGMSSGMKRSITQRQATPPAATPAPRSAQQAQQAANPAAAAAAPKSGASRWLGPLAGLAAGLGLAALFSHLGLGAEMANFMLLLLLGVGLFLVIRLVMRRKAGGVQSNARLQPAAAYAGQAPHFEPLTTPAASAGVAAAATATTAAAAIPAGFDAAGFLRQAKLNFIRLQAANDAGNMEDIRSYTTPELFAEIRLQHQERGAAAQQTDVQALEAELLEVVEEGAQQIASVRFHGLIQEEAARGAEPFSEVWHLTRAVDGSSGWVIAGIEQQG